MSIESQSKPVHRGVTPDVPDLWTPEQIIALETWTQGSLFHGSVSAWAIPEANVTHEPPDYPFDLDVAFRTNIEEWSIVTSQTCDIAVTGSGKNQPFVQVSPLVKIDGEDEGFIRNVRIWSVTYLAPVAGPDVDGEWAVDLRISTPVSKLVLAAKEPVPWPSSEDQLVLFANHVARRTSRPAFHDGIVSIEEVINADIKASRKAKDEGWFEKVEQVRLEIQGTRLAPQVVTIHIVCNEQLTNLEKDKWRQIRKRVATLLANLGATLGTIKFHERSTIDPRDYREWHPFFIAELQDHHYL